MPVCPNCGVVLSDTYDDYGNCPNCGESLNRSYCPDCGKKVKDTDKFCGSCGTKLMLASSSIQAQGNIGEEQKSAKSIKKGKMQIIVGILLIVVGAIVTGISVLLASKSGTYYIYTGLFVVGGINIVIGFIRYIAS